MSRSRGGSFGGANARPAFRLSARERQAKRERAHARMAAAVQHLEARAPNAAGALLLRCLGFIRALIRAIRGKTSASP